jgi:hypothetical protein
MSCHLYRSTYYYYPQAPEEKQRTTKELRAHKKKKKNQPQKTKTTTRTTTQIRGRTHTHTQSPISSNQESNLQPKIRTHDYRKDFFFSFGLAKILSLYCSFCFAAAAAKSGAKEDKRKRETKERVSKASDKALLKRCQEVR